MTGCLVGPNFKQPDMSVQCEWMECENERIVCEAPFREAWWSYFEDPMLNCLIEMATGQNLTLKQAGMRVLEARAEMGIAVGQFFPQLQQLVGSAQRVKVSENAPNAAFIDHNYWDFISGLQVAWELDFWGRFRRGIEAADENLLATEANFQDVLLILISDVASAYVQMRTFESQVEILERNIKLQTRSLEISEARWRGGMVTDLDVQQAKTLLYLTKARLPDVTNNLRQTKNALAVLLGMLPDQMDGLITPSTYIPVAPPEIAVGIPAELICRRPDVRRAMHVAASQSAQVGIAVSELLPRISLTGFIGFEYAAATGSRVTGTEGGFFDIKSLTYSVGPQFAWPILNYGRLTNNVRAEKTRFYQALLSYENSVLRAFQEAEDGLSAFIQAHIEVADLELSVKAAERSAQIAQTQYVEGIADYTRVLQADRSQVENENFLAISRGKIALSLIQTYKSLGGGWQPFVCESD